MITVIWQVFCSIFYGLFFGWLYTVIYYFVKVKKNHLEKESEEVKEQVKTLKIWEIPSIIFLVLLGISGALIVIGIFLIIIYFIAMIIGSIILIFMAIAGADISFVDTVNQIVFGYWNYGRWGIPGILISTVFFMIRGIFVKD